MMKLDFKKSQFFLFRDYVNKNKITEAIAGSENQSNFDYVDFYIEEILFERAFLSKNVKENSDFYFLFKNGDLSLLDKYQVCERYDNILYITLLGIDLSHINL